MKKDKLYSLLVAKMQEVTIVPPQTVGPLTPIYKKVAAQLKVYPWRWAFMISVSVTFLAYFLFGGMLVKIASMLQYGF